MSTDGRDAAAVNRRQLAAAEMCGHVSLRLRLAADRGELSEADAMAQLQRLADGLEGLHGLAVWLDTDVCKEVGARLHLMFIRDELAGAVERCRQAIASGAENGLLL
jgi:hypothetical protein